MPNVGPRLTSSHRILSRATTTLFVLGFACSAHAQHANENAVAEASDAFGTSIGREEIGLYTAQDARGFDPSQAGNRRLAGLYFDQVGFSSNLVNRIVRGNTVHVGISAQGFPFPAPTGVVDYQLLTPDNTPGANILLGVASYDQQYAEIDIHAPVIQDRLSLGGGLGYTHNGSYKFTGDSDNTTAGLIARWQINDNLVITPFWSAVWMRQRNVKPFVLLGDSPPQYRPTDLTDWPGTRFSFNANNYGMTLRNELPDHWLLEAGLFRSEVRSEPNQDVILADVNSAGQGVYSIEASPRYNNSSTSGELRLAKQFSTERNRNTFYLSAKGRDRRLQFGGIDEITFGPGTLTSLPADTHFAYQTEPSSTVKVHQVTPGIAYEGVWHNIGQVSVGVQKSFYEATTSEPGVAQVSDRQQPLLYNFGTAAFVTPALAVYAGFTRGFEEVGVAPIAATNRDQAVPAQLTRQIDAGIKYSLATQLTLVAGVFEINKPYFDLDQKNFYRRIGTTRNQGVELSLSGAATERVTVVAGYIYIKPQVQHDDGSGVQTSSVAVGPVPGMLRANAQYRTRFLDGLILETQIEHLSRRYARYPSIRLPAATSVDLGARYNTQLLNRPATWRLQLYNVTNTSYLRPSASGELDAADGSHAELSLAIDY